MEITELNLISDFESHIFPISAFSRVPKIISLCKWGALILAVLLISRIKLLVLKVCRIKFISSSVVDSIKLLNDDDFDSDDDVDDACSSVSSEDLDDTDNDEERDGFSDVDYSGGLGRRFSWSDFSAGKSVVKLWDNLTSGFDPDDDMDETHDLSSDIVSFWEFPGERRDDPTVVISAEKADNGRVLLGLYDSRVGRGSPEMTADWPLLRRRTVAGVSPGGIEKIYDLRNVKSPLVG